MHGRRHSVGAFPSGLPGVPPGGLGSNPSSPPVGQRFQHVGRMIGEEVDARPPSPAFAAATMPGGRRSSFSMGGPKAKEQNPLWQAAAITQGLGQSPMPSTSPEEDGPKLREAMLSKDCGVLLQAIGQARMNGFDKKEVDKAVKVLQRVECQEGLQRAQKTGDLEGLRAAMRRARHLNFDAVLLEKPQKVLESLESQEMLEIAIRNRETGSLRACIDVAASRGVNPKLIEEAKHVFAQMTAQMQLNAACKGKDADKLEEALEKAKISGMEAGSLSQAQDYLNYLRAQEGSSAKDKEKGKAQPDDSDPVVEILQRAIGMRETGCLRMAIQTAKSARGDHEELVAEAERMLGHVEAELLLPPAIKKQDRKKLTEAVKKAEGCGLQSSLLDQAKYILAQMDGRDQLSKAMGRRKSCDIRDAIDNASALGLEKARIDKAEHLFQQACIRESLIEAAEGTDAEALQSAINAAKAAGIEKKEVDKAEFAMKALSGAPVRMGRRASAG